MNIYSTWFVSDRGPNVWELLIIASINEYSSAKHHLSLFYSIHCPSFIVCVSNIRMSLCVSLINAFYVFDSCTTLCLSIDQCIQCFWLLYNIVRINWSIDHCFPCFWLLCNIVRINWSIYLVLSTLVQCCSSFNENNTFAKQSEGPIKQPTVYTVNASNGVILNKWADNL